MLTFDRLNFENSTESCTVSNYPQKTLLSVGIHLRYSLIYKTAIFYCAFMVLTSEKVKTSEKVNT